MYVFQVLDDLFADHLDTNYSISDAPDETRRHRAIRLMKPGLEHSGAYMCRVSTLKGEDFKLAEVVVYGEGFSGQRG